MRAPMPHPLVETITADAPEIRDRPLDTLVGDATQDELLAATRALEAFRQTSDNLYARVRALFFLCAIHRDHVPRCEACPAEGAIPAAGVERLHARDFEAAIARFASAQRDAGPSVALSSALAAAYRGLAFQTLADQVRRSVRAAEGNAWMFDHRDPAASPLRIRASLRDGRRTLCERTPVRMDLTHAGWSDIFFLAMDAPERAQVINVSIDLGVRGRDARPRPPIETTLRTLDAPVLRLRSVDLGAEAELTTLREVFETGADHLGLLKAAVIASGLVPFGLEEAARAGAPLTPLLAEIAGTGRGLEITSHVREIPKGSRLAVSTNLLASLIALCMRATSQCPEAEGSLGEDARRAVAARAILGEWLGGSGGGWQDSGGLWPGAKHIRGERAREGDPEWGVSRGRLLPRHYPLGPDEASPETLAALSRSLVLVHGGMAQDVGPILEMVTERYLLRSEPAWRARDEALVVLGEIRDALARGDLRALGGATHRNFAGPLQTIIPWATNAFTEALIDETRAHFGDEFWGFWMLGGMSGGGMGLLFAPAVREGAATWLGRAMRRLKQRFEHGLVFAMDPVVYDFEINRDGSHAVEAERNVAAATGQRIREANTSLIAAPEPAGSTDADALARALEANGFDPDQHERIRAALRSGEIGLAQNRRPQATRIDAVRAGDVERADAQDTATRDALRRDGEARLRAGQVGVVTLAGGSGSRWTQGAGVVKALCPFAPFAGRHRRFVDVHLAKSRRTARAYDAPIEHVFTTSHLTHDALAAAVAALPSEADVTPRLSRGRGIGLRLVPTERDLRFAWQESGRQRLDERAEKQRASAQDALIQWARGCGEASDYRTGPVAQCLHPIGHFYEVPSLLRNGTLRALLERRPQLETLLLHNIDTVGATLDPLLLGLHAARGATLSFEVTPRRIDDQGGGLARVDGHLCLVEGLALPDEDDAWRMAYYNTMTTWIDVDALLSALDLDRAALDDAARVAAALDALARRMPTYVTLKDAKHRWGHGHEDVFPVLQFEKLWSDMTLLPDLHCAYLAVPRARGAQLKEPAQLDAWLGDGSHAWVAARCDFDDARPQPHITAADEAAPEARP